MFKKIPLIGRWLGSNRSAAESPAVRRAITRRKRRNLVATLRALLSEAFDSTRAYLTGRPATPRARHRELLAQLKRRTLNFQPLESRALLATFNAAATAGQPITVVL